MNSNPYFNEPGNDVVRICCTHNSSLSKEARPGDAQKYSLYVEHETLRVAVCGMLENPTWGNQPGKKLRQFFLIPKALSEVMRSHFLSNYEKYIQKATKRKAEVEGKQLIDPLFGYTAAYAYDRILERLQKVWSFETFTYYPSYIET